MRIDSFASTFCSAFQHEVISDNLTVIPPFNVFFSLCYTINLSKYNWWHWQHFYIAMRKIVIIRRMNRAYDDFSLFDIFELVWIVKKKSHWIEFSSFILQNPQYFIPLISDICVRSTVIYINLSGIGKILGAFTKISRAGVWREIFQSLKNSRTDTCFIKHFLEPSFSNPKTWDTPAHPSAFCVLEHLQCFILLN